MNRTTERELQTYVAGLEEIRSNLRFLPYVRQRIIRLLQDSDALMPPWALTVHRICDHLTTASTLQLLDEAIRHLSTVAFSTDPLDDDEPDKSVESDELDLEAGLDDPNMDPAAAGSYGSVVRYIPRGSIDLEKIAPGDVLVRTFATNAPIITGNDPDDAHVHTDTDSAP